MFKFSTALAASIALAAAAQAAEYPATVTPISFGTAGYGQSFDTLASTGTTGTALPAGWQVNEIGTNANGTYGVDNGGSNSGNVYSYGSTGSTDRALGSLGSGSLSPAQYGAFFTNGIGSTIASLTIAYTGEQWRAGNSADDGLVFQYSLDATALDNGTWTTIDALGFAPVVLTGNKALDGNAADNQRAISGTIDSLAIAAGNGFAIRWTDVNSGGNDHGLAIDNLSISAASAAAAVPEVGTWAMMVMGFGLLGAALRRRPAVRLA